VSQGLWSNCRPDIQLTYSPGQLEAAQLENARVAFSVPIVLTYSHPLICGPILASHPLDLQSFPVSMASGAFNAHIGPPAPNVEVKLSGVDDDAVDAGKDPEGEVSHLLFSFDFFSYVSTAFRARTTRRKTTTR